MAFLKQQKRKRRDFFPFPDVSAPVVGRKKFVVGGRDSESPGWVSTQQQQLSGVAQLGTRTPYGVDELVGGRFGLWHIP